MTATEHPDQRTRRQRAPEEAPNAELVRRLLKAAETAQPGRDLNIPASWSP